MGVIVVILILISVHVLIVVIIVVVMLVTGTIDHGHGTTSDQKEGLGNDQENTRGKEGTGCEGWDAQIDELVAVAGIRGPGGSCGGLTGLLSATDLRTEYSRDEEDDTAEGCDVDQECGQDDLLPGLLLGVGVGIHCTGRELILLVVIFMALTIFVFLLVVVLLFYNLS